MELGTGRPDGDPHHHMEPTEDELRDRQKPAVAGLANWLVSVEEVGEGGCVGTLERQEIQET